MKGLEKITQRIRSDAQAEIDAIRAEGDAKAAAIAADYQAKADALAAAEAEKTRLAVEALTQRGQRSDAMDKSKAILGAKQGCIDEAFDLAAKKLSALPREEYIAVLAKMAAAAGAGDEEIILSAADADIGPDVVEKANAQGGHFTLSGETRDMEGGLVLKRGDVEVNCAFATQLRLLRQTMAADVAAILFN